MVGPPLSKERWRQTYEGAEPEVTSMILQAQDEWSGEERESGV